MKLYDADGEGERQKYPLERGWVKLKLIRELATGTKTQVVLADEYGVAEHSITRFKRRHLTEIQEVQADIENKFASLWIAQKEYRLAELQHDVDEIGDTRDPEMMRNKHTALKQAAEELGQLPSRFNMQVNTAPITYKIEGVDLEQLR